MVVTFKEKVRLALLKCAKLYKEKLVDSEYLIYSSEFHYQKYYQIASKEDNFLHLTGVLTKLTAQTFFDKCYDGSLLEEDFDLGNKSQKGSIRRKISVLEQGILIFYDNGILVEEKFEKNKISCSFATSDNLCTMGFTKTRLAKPQTLLKGNQLSSSITPDLILKRSKDSNSFDTVIKNSLNLTDTEISAILIDGD
ncbi:TPA: hypothetical protein TVK17_001623 [Streptococcus equi subsp. zooepidemicus]|nr:hypothetical protein [Streptococcus equi subsp. zooepidemicus]